MLLIDFSLKHLVKFHFYVKQAYARTDVNEEQTFTVVTLY